jgi:AcrR family transcriptional regulator
MSRNQGTDPPGGSRQTDAILKVTLELLVEGGNRAVTTDSVAERASVSKSTIYRRWRSRSALVVAAAGQLMAPVDVPDLGSVQDELRYLLEHRLAQYQVPAIGPVMSAIIGAAAEDEEVRELFQAWVNSEREATHAVIRRAADRGELNSDIDTDALATIAGAPMFHRSVVEGRSPDQKLVDGIVRLLESFLNTPRAGRPATAGKGTAR